MQPRIAHQNKILFQLTALWAFGESGLGGFMHALRIPFTGFFVGGFAIMILIMFATYSAHNAGRIVQATLVVMAVKFAASPQSPLPAYIAVAFQGLLAALILGVLKGKKLGALVYGCLALGESAIQKFLVTTLIFGKSIWEALDLFVQGVCKDFGLNPQFSFSTWLMAGYCMLYAVWGLFLGWYAYRLPVKLNASAGAVMEQYHAAEKQSSTGKLPTHAHKYKKLLFNLAVLLFIVLVFWFNTFSTNKAMYAIIRTVAALSFIYIVLIPVSRWLLGRLLSDPNKNKQVKQVMDELPKVRTRAAVVWGLALKQNGRLSQLRYFITALMVVTLYGVDEEPPL